MKDYRRCPEELKKALESLQPVAELHRDEPERFDEPELRGREARERGKGFEEEIAALYSLLGFQVDRSRKIEGVQYDVCIHQSRGGLPVDAAIECKDCQVDAGERDKIIVRREVLLRKHPGWRMVAVTSRGFADDARNALESLGIVCRTHCELLNELLPLEQYVQILVRDHETWLDDPEKGWGGRNLFVHPWIVDDIKYEQSEAIGFLGRWLGDARQNFLIILGDLGTGKTTLAQFLAYHLGRAFLEDPVRHPAPVLIPLREARRAAFSLETIVCNHFYNHALRDVSFSNFEHLLRRRRIVLFLDAFDEMADRIRWDETRGNFAELKRAASTSSKVLLTCRTHYFKSREERIELTGSGPTFTEATTDLYKDIAREPGLGVVNLCEFDDDQIREYLRKARPDSHVQDWETIQDIHDLPGLAHRPLLLDMIVKSLPRLRETDRITASELYTVYTDIWIQREEIKHPMLKPRHKLELMMELAWWLYTESLTEIPQERLTAFVEDLFKRGNVSIRDEDPRDIVREMHTATFLKHGRDKSFAFVHRSFMEYFLARKIALSFGIVPLRSRVPIQPPEEHDLSVLDVPRLDQKIVFFLTGLDGEDKLREPLRQVLSGAYRAQVSENALQVLYWSGRIRAGAEKEIPDVANLRRVLGARIPESAQLPGAQLDKIVLECAPLIRANLREACLVSANLNRAILTEADLNAAKLQDAVLSDAQMEGTAGLDLHRGAAGEMRRRDLVASVQLGHGGKVNCVAFSPDGALLVSCGDDRVVRLWRTSDGRLLRTLAGHQHGVLSVAFSGDGQTLASGSADKTVKLWEAATGRELRTLAGHQNGVWSVAFSGDGQTLASGSEDHTVKLWEAATGRELRTLTGHQNWVLSVAFSGDGQTLASGSHDHTVKLWEAATGRELRTLGGHKDSVRSVALSGDGQTLASGSHDHTVKLWEAVTGRELRTLAGHQNWVWSVAFSGDGRTLASGSSDQTVKLWEAATGRELRTLASHKDWVWSVAFSGDGQTLASGSDDHAVKLWDSATGRELRTLTGHQNWVLSVAFSGDGQTFASGSSDQTVKLWDSATGHELWTLAAHKAEVLSVAFSGDGQTLASGSSDQTVKLWDSATGRALRTLAGHKDWVWSVAFSRDGRTFASGSSDHTVKLWEAATGRELRTLAGHQRGVSSVTFSGDGQTLASGSEDKTVKLWEAATGRELRTLAGHQHWVRSVAFSRDGQTLASGSSDQTVKLWEAATGRELRTLAGHQNGVRSVAFSRDGQMLASGSEDHTVKLWDSATGRELRTLAGHQNWVFSVAFSRDGRTLASGSLDASIRLWSVAEGREICASWSIGEGVWLVLLPDGRFDASPRGLQYLAYTEKGTFNSFTAEEVKNLFYDPEGVRREIARYLPAPAASAQ